MRFFADSIHIPIAAQVCGSVSTARGSLVVCAQHRDKSSAGLFCDSTRFFICKAGSWEKAAKTNVEFGSLCSWRPYNFSTCAQVLLQHTCLSAHLIALTIGLLALCCSRACAQVLKVFARADTVSVGAQGLGMGPFISPNRLVQLYLPRLPGDLISS